MSRYDNRYTHYFALNSDEAKVEYRRVDLHSEGYEVLESLNTKQTLVVVEHIIKLTRELIALERNRDNG